MNTQERTEITNAALLGQAAGDAFGVPVEFLSREEVRGSKNTKKEHSSPFLRECPAFTFDSSAGGVVGWA